MNVRMWLRADIILGDGVTRSGLSKSPDTYLAGVVRASGETAVKPSKSFNLQVLTLLLSIPVVEIY